MKTIKGIIFGLIFGFVISLCFSFLFMGAAQGLAGGFTSLAGERWVYYATFPPFTITFSILGFYFARQDNVSNKKLWFLSIISALFNSLYTGTIGALFGEYALRGGSLRTYTASEAAGINVEGVLIWGTLYAFILLPLTVPLARLLIGAFLELLKKFKINKCTA
ncbi:hypothetical protein BK139_17755 [Paenibacillus sp. FSL R5-0490]|uniref:hypothetical protein n=1 Tax=Paenibacillus sp. FSL R5-0490 TaxID=1920424 RepID=UPI00096F6880|nr:hypothetical protein [Paenibacillus sp. FSL R5-0490]OMF55193.1 hypothetical protein BK139_17755 [Paenibacillus sp. FSL R5-0490]